MNLRGAVLLPIDVLPAVASRGRSGSGPLTWPTLAFEFSLGEPVEANRRCMPDGIYGDFVLAVDGPII